MTPEQLRSHPEGKWNAAEVLEHLYLTYTGTIKGCERCLEAGMPQAREVSFKNRLEQFVVITCSHMPDGRQAPERTRPTGAAGKHVGHEIAARIGEMENVLQRCESRFGGNTRFMNHPVLGPLSVAQWRKFHWVHGWHHVKQIRRLRGMSV